MARRQLDVLHLRRHARQLHGCERDLGTLSQATVAFGAVGTRMESDLDRLDDAGRNHCFCSLPREQCGNGPPSLRSDAGRGKEGRSQRVAVRRDAGRRAALFDAAGMFCCRLSDADQSANHATSDTRAGMAKVVEDGPGDGTLFMETDLWLVTDNRVYICTGASLAGKNGDQFCLFRILKKVTFHVRGLSASSCRRGFSLA